MQRYFVEKELWKDNKVSVVGEDVHHITKVMRMNKGDTLVCVHPEHGAAVCEISDFAKQSVDCAIQHWLDENRELPVHVTIVQSLGKGDKLDQVVQKGTELGADSFIPFQAARSVVKWDEKKASKKIDRLKKIAKEASEQSERTHVPDVDRLHTLRELLARRESFDWCLFGYEGEARGESPASLSSRLNPLTPGQKILIVFGPEGGFSTKEAATLMEHHFLPCRLGPRILRMETAPLYFLSSLSYKFEEQ